LVRFYKEELKVKRISKAAKVIRNKPKSCKSYSAVFGVPTSLVDIVKVKNLTLFSEKEKVGSKIRG